MFHVSSACSPCWRSRRPPLRESRASKRSPGEAHVEEGRVTRRRLMAGAAAGAVGTALANVPGAEARKPKRARARRAAAAHTADVVVVGAGLAGLSAARIIQAAGKKVGVVE